MPIVGLRGGLQALRATVANRHALLAHAIHWPLGQLMSPSTYQIAPAWLECPGWELQPPINTGTWCTVHRARPVGAGGANWPYCLKVLRAEMQSDAQAIARLRQEAHVGRLVSHPNIAAALDASVGRNPYFIVLPWLEGDTAAALARSRCLPPANLATAIVRQVAGALSALHATGWLHGDIKPANIMVARAGHATLFDLGFATRISPTSSGSETWLSGTIDYLAPERLTSAIRADVRSDLYSLGATWFELLTGRPPFAGIPAEIARQHVSTPAPSVRALAPQVPLGVAALVAQLLSKDPLRRLASAAELIDRIVPLEIEHLADSLPKMDQIAPTRNSAWPVTGPVQVA